MLLVRAAISEFSDQIAAFMRSIASLSTETGAALEKIIGGVESTAAKIAEIATATVEQSHNAQEVANAITSVADVTETNAAGSEQLASSSEELGAQSTTLREMVGRFLTR